jgi:acyl carrier protein
MSIQASEARRIVAAAVTRLVPDADVEGVPDDADLRQAFELDSLDFLGFVEQVGEATGIRIDEDDYPELATMASCERFITRRTATSA